MKKVLIVDDDRATSAGMADVIEEWGYEAEVADTLKAGWASVSKMVPDVAIVDLKLPDGSGLEFGTFVGGHCNDAITGIALDGRDEIVPDRAEVRAPNACSEDREQCVGVCEQETLLPVDPEQVQLPVVVGRRELAERE